MMAVSGRLWGEFFVLFLTVALPHFPTETITIIHRVSIGSKVLPEEEVSLQLKAEYLQNIS